MDRHTRHVLFAGGLGLLFAAAPGCRTPRTEVPPEPSFSHPASAAERSQVGFSSEPPAIQANPMPNGLPGTTPAPGNYGATPPTFSTNGPQTQSGQPGSTYTPQSIDSEFDNPRGQMGQPGQPPQPQ